MCTEAQPRRVRIVPGSARPWRPTATAAACPHLTATLVLPWLLVPGHAAQRNSSAAQRRAPRRGAARRTRQALVVAPQLVRLIAVVLDRLVVDQRVGRARAGLAVGRVHGLPELDAPLRDAQRVRGVRHDRASRQARKHRPALDRQDACACARARSDAALPACRGCCAPGRRPSCASRASARAATSPRRSPCRHHPPPQPTLHGCSAAARQGRHFAGHAVAGASSPALPSRCVPVQSAPPASPGAEHLHGRAA